ncbi:GAF domain-containing protein [Anabaena sp. UHCC 0399]|uniref:GAF domain-containing protein n=1 Tax=Anabaena sp. UHCC 0399 TaxID=3110238 RepID=UPI002B20C270|nr:GAF domain-containing protein [Anabaena sp. UHCC 0399]MEA5568724.1 GAF domain-containing protein [Anabaena sp. UHCC 0399]
MSFPVADVLEAGRIYRSIGKIPIDLLRVEVYRAWERSHLQGANPHALQAEKLSVLDTERLVESNTYLINAARPYFRILSQAVGRERHAVMLSNHHAILLDVFSDEQTINETEGFPPPGTLMSEAVAGANGIGTPLAEENYTEIVAAEHFIEGFHPFSCQGTPLRNDQGEIVGVLSISARSPDVRQRLKEILICASHGIEAEFLVANLEKDVRHVLESHDDDYQPLENLRQDIIQAHQASRLQLEIVSRMVVVNRIDYAMQLLQQAEKSIQLFRRRATFWRKLASFQRDVPQPLLLTDAICSLVDLLSTEAAIRKVEVVLYLTEPIIVVADLNSLLRKLLRYFLQAFEIANQGGTVAVAVNQIPNSELVEVSFKPTPVFNIAQLDIAPATFTIPRGEKM